MNVSNQKSDAAPIAFTKQTIPRLTPIDLRINAIAGDDLRPIWEERGEQHLQKARDLKAKGFFKEGEVEQRSARLFLRARAAKNDESVTQYFLQRKLFEDAGEYLNDRKLPNQTEKVNAQIKAGEYFGITEALQWVDAHRSRDLIYDVCTQLITDGKIEELLKLSSKLRAPDQIRLANLYTQESFLKAVKKDLSERGISEEDISKGYNITMLPLDENLEENVLKLADLELADNDPAIDLEEGFFLQEESIHLELIDAFKKTKNHSFNKLIFGGCQILIQARLAKKVLEFVGFCKSLSLEESQSEIAKRILGNTEGFSEEVLAAYSILGLNGEKQGIDLLYERGFGAFGTELRSMCENLVTMGHIDLAATLARKLSMSKQIELLNSLEKQSYAKEAYLLLDQVYEGASQSEILQACEDFVKEDPWLEALTAKLEPRSYAKVPKLLLKAERYDKALELLLQLDAQFQDALVDGYSTLYDAQRRDLSDQVLPKLNKSLIWLAEPNKTELKRLRYGNEYRKFEVEDPPHRKITREEAVVSIAEIEGLVSQANQESDYEEILKKSLPMSACNFDFVNPAFLQIARSLVEKNQYKCAAGIALSRKPDFQIGFIRILHQEERYDEVLDFLSKVDAEFVLELGKHNVFLKELKGEALLKLASLFIKDKHHWVAIECLRSVDRSALQPQVRDLCYQWMDLMIKGSYQSRPADYQILEIAKYADESGALLPAIYLYSKLDPHTHQEKVLTLCLKLFKSEGSEWQSFCNKVVPTFPKPFVILLRMTLEYRKQFYYAVTLSFKTAKGSAQLSAQELFAEEMKHFVTKAPEKWKDKSTDYNAMLRYLSWAKPILSEKTQKEMLEVAESFLQKAQNRMAASIALRLNPENQQAFITMLMRQCSYATTIEFLNQVDKSKLPFKEIFAALSEKAFTDDLLSLINGLSQELLSTIQDELLAICQRISKKEEAVWKRAFDTIMPNLNPVSATMLIRYLANQDRVSQLDFAFSKNYVNAESISKAQSELIGMCLRVSRGKVDVWQKAFDAIIPKLDQFSMSVLVGVLDHQVRYQQLDRALSKSDVTLLQSEISQICKQLIENGKLTTAQTLTKHLRGEYLTELETLIAAKWNLIAWMA